MMKFAQAFKSTLAFTMCYLFCVSALAKDRKAPAPAAASKPSYEMPQPEKEAIDYAAYHLIREEGIKRSHVMEFASGLMDGIGARLTGSPNLKRANEWTRDQLTAMGCVNAHLEDWGEFGMGWQQLNAAVRMTAPDMAVLIAQAGPWSPSTGGTVSASATWVEVKEEKDFDKYKGKLSGKIVLLDEMREVKPVDEPLFKRYDENKLKEIVQYPLERDSEDGWHEYLKKKEFREKVGKFLAAEHVQGVIVPSRDGSRNGGSGGTIFDDSGASFAFFSYQRDHANPLPVAVMAIEHYGRIYRLLKANVPVQLELNLETRFTGDHEHGFDTIAEIPGTDPVLKDEVVMVGGHLDSWASATGATDNGAGTVVAMEVMRILNALKVKPRRTIRIGLWTGEEQGEFGSFGYVKQHFGFIPRSTDTEQLKFSEFDRKPAGPVQVLPEQSKISGYFNVDNGSGKIRGIYLQGNLAVAPIFAQWIEPLRDLGVTTITARDTGGTDHEAFDAVGVPGFQFIQDQLDYSSRTHHSNMDLYERLQPQDLAQAAVVEATFVYNTAMRDQMLPRKPMPHPELEEQRLAPLKGVMPGAVEEKKEEKKDEK